MFALRPMGKRRDTCRWRVECELVFSLLHENDDIYLVQIKVVGIPRIGHVKVDVWRRNLVTTRCGSWRLRVGHVDVRSRCDRVCRVKRSHAP